MVMMMTLSEGYEYLQLRQCFLLLLVLMMMMILKAILNSSKASVMGAFQNTDEAAQEVL